jgi:hypothetical protein
MLPADEMIVLRNWTDADTALLQGVYILQCKSRMNAIYYERRLGRLQKHSFWMEVAIALAASGSGVGAALQTNKPWGPEIWQALALVAAFVAIIRPIYAPGKKIEIFTRQHQGYHANFFALDKLAFGIRQAGQVTDEHRRRYDTFYDRHVQLSTEDEQTPHDRCLTYARRRTEQELPSNKFWWPPDVAAKVDDQKLEKSVKEPLTPPSLSSPLDQLQADKPLSPVSCPELSTTRARIDPPSC